MENTESKYNSGSNQKFFSRGCCHAPQVYHDNKNIAADRCCKLNSHDWMKNIQLPEDQELFDCVEIRFKNSRKEFFRIQGDFKYEPGDIVAVEASPGHDIGIVSLSGEIVKLQMRKKGVDPNSPQIKKVYRRARLTDIEKWMNAVELESEATLKSRQLAWDLRLNMKINDVEYQGDETKAVFYYTADERVDFRELIKVLAEHFKVRVEMRQIGARQEAARLGGIGTCGRELCCSTWLCEFSSVSTNKARTQQMPMNPQKLAGQCGKLKCCLNYEYDVYLDALKEFPDMNIKLRTEKGDAIHLKSDIFKKVMWYSYLNDQSSMMALSIENVKKIIEGNRKGLIPKSLEDLAIHQETKTEDVGTNLHDEDIHRFDSKDDRSGKKSGKKWQKGKPRHISKPHHPSKPHTGNHQQQSPPPQGEN